MYKIPGINYDGHFNYDALTNETIDKVVSVAAYSPVVVIPRDIDVIAKEMHELLKKSGEKTPYILLINFNT